jgi:hypothetical protein
MRLSILWLALALVLGPLSSSPAYAAEPDPRAEARALFQEGVALAEADRWAEALDAFRRSNDLVARPSTSYNIANALYRLDRPVDALAELDEHDRMPEVLTNPNAQARSGELRTLVGTAIAEIELSVSPASAKVFIDGWPTSLDGARRTLRLNPGSHFVQVTRDGYHPQRQEVRVRRGGRQSLRIALEPIEPAAVTEAPNPLPAASVGISQVTPASDPTSTADDRKPFVKRPGFWVLIGVVSAAAIGAGVAVAVTRRDDAPACGTTGDCATTQGLTVGF